MLGLLLSHAFVLVVGLLIGVFSAGSWVGEDPEEAGHEARLAAIRQRAAERARTRELIRALPDADLDRLMETIFSDDLRDRLDTEKQHRYIVDRANLHLS